MSRYIPELAINLERVGLDKRVANTLRWGPNSVEELRDLFDKGAYLRNGNPKDRISGVGPINYVKIAVYLAIYTREAQDITRAERAIAAEKRTQTAKHEELIASLDQLRDVLNEGLEGTGPPVSSLTKFKPYWQ